MMDISEQCGGGGHGGSGHGGSGHSGGFVAVVVMIMTFYYPHLIPPFTTYYLIVTPTPTTPSTLYATIVVQMIGYTNNRFYWSANNNMRIIMSVEHRTSNSLYQYSGIFTKAQTVIHTMKCLFMSAAAHKLTIYRPLRYSTCVKYILRCTIIM